MPERTEAEKLKRKEAHRLSMVASGGLFVVMALSAGAVFLSRGGAPKFLLGGGDARTAARADLSDLAPSLTAWQPWGPAVTARAKKEGKPILLCVYTRFSYWSRLMDGRAYADPAVAELISRRFVAARADADARPDVARRYLSNGAPTAAVLLPNGQILDSAPYMEPEPFKVWLTALADGWSQGRARAEASAAKALEERAKAEEPVAAPAEEIAARASAELSRPAARAPREDLVAGKEDRFFVGPRARTGSKADLERVRREGRRGDVFLRELGARDTVQGLLDDSLGAAEGFLAAHERGEGARYLTWATEAALGAERAFYDAGSPALFDRVALGELPAPLDRLLDPELNYQVWSLSMRLARLLPAGHPARERFRKRALELRPWLLARAPYLRAAQRLTLATIAVKPQP